jgi:hypothetical protein
MITPDDSPRWQPQMTTPDEVRNFVSYFIHKFLNLGLPEWELMGSFGYHLGGHLVELSGLSSGLPSELSSEYRKSFGYVFWGCHLRFTSGGFSLGCHLGLPSGAVIWVVIWVVICVSGLSSELSPGFSFGFSSGLSSGPVGVIWEDTLLILFIY